MKKKYLIVFMLVCLLVITGCGKKEEEKNLLDPSDVLDVTNQVKERTIKDIAYNLRQETNLFYMTKLMIGDDFEETTFMCNGEECSNDEEKLDLIGTIPSAGKITISPNGEMKFSNIVIDGYKCNIPSSGNITCTK